MFKRIVICDIFNGMILAVVILFSHTADYK